MGGSVQSPLRALALLARSARKRQSELRGVLVPFVPVSASWYGSQELKTLHRAEWIGGWPQPQGRALFSGLYINELMLKLTAREDPIPELYDALEAVMRAVCGENSLPLRCGVSNGLYLPAWDSRPICSTMATAKQSAPKKPTG